MTTQQVLEVTELCGDGIGPELEDSVATIADALPIDFRFEKIDWSLATREEKGLIAIDEAESSMRRTGVGLKYPTVTGTIAECAASAAAGFLGDLSTLHFDSRHLLQLQGKRRLAHCPRRDGGIYDLGQAHRQACGRFSAHGGA